MGLQEAGHCARVLLHSLTKFRPPGRQVRRQSCRIIRGDAAGSGKGGGHLPSQLRVDFWD